MPMFGNAASAQFEFAAIFESQVEPQNRDFALTAGKRVFKAYKLCGAYDDLLKQLQQSVEPPRFEFKVDGLIEGVPFTGKPDCRFVLDLGQGRIPCIYDWKVRGYCSKYGASPSKGYATCLDGFVGKASRSQGKEHAMYKAMDFRGLTINSGYMEFCNDEYADQLCLYGWLLGEKIGDENTVLGIEELCAKFMGEGNPPTLRYARHRGRVKADYQLKLAERVTDLLAGHHQRPRLHRSQPRRQRCPLRRLGRNVRGAHVGRLGPGQMVLRRNPPQLLPLETTMPIPLFLLDRIKTSALSGEKVANAFAKLAQAADRPGSTAAPSISNTSRTTTS